jgi:hypothetical protein
MCSRILARHSSRGGGNQNLVRPSLPGFLDKQLNEVDEHLCGFFEAKPRIEFELAVKVVASGEQVRARQSSKCQTRSIGPAANRFYLRSDPGSARRFHGVFGELRIIFQHLFHVLVVFSYIHRNSDVRIFLACGHSHLLEQRFLCVEPANFKIAKKYLQVDSSNSSCE